MPSVAWRTLALQQLRRPSGRSGVRLRSGNPGIAHLHSCGLRLYAEDRIREKIPLWPSPGTPAPPRRHRRRIGEASAMADSCTDEQFYWRPRDGRAGASRMSRPPRHDELVYGTRFGGGRSGPARGSTRGAPAKPGYFGGKFVQSMEPPVKRRCARRAMEGRSRRRSGAHSRGISCGHELIRELIAEAGTIDAIVLGSRIRFSRS